MLLEVQCGDLREPGWRSFPHGVQLFTSLSDQLCYCSNPNGNIDVCINIYFFLFNLNFYECLTVKEEVEG